MKMLKILSGVFVALLVFGSVASAIPYSFEFTTQELTDAANDSGILPMDSNGIYMARVITRDFKDGADFGYTLTSVAWDGPEDWVAAVETPILAAFRDDPTTTPVTLLTDNANYPNVAGEGTWTINIETDEVVTDSVDWLFFVYGTPLNADGTDAGEDFGWEGGFIISKSPADLQATGDPTHAVPEPASIVMIGAGLAGIVLGRRKKRI